MKKGNNTVRESQKDKETKQSRDRPEEMKSIRERKKRAQRRRREPLRTGTESIGPCLVRGPGPGKS